MVQNNLPLFGLIGWFNSMNAPDAEFWITNGLHEQLGWSVPVLRQARQAALDGGWIVGSLPRHRESRPLPMGTNGKSGTGRRRKTGEGVSY